MAQRQALPTELRTERLILRSADMNNDADCAKVTHVRCDASGGAKHNIKDGSEAIRELRYKSKVHGPRQELCTLSKAPGDIFWLIWLPFAHEEGNGTREDEDLENLVGLIVMSFRQEMPYPDMGYVTVAAHGGHGYASEAGGEMLHYWRDLVGVKEIFIGCPEDNKLSQRCAERIGFVHGGKLMSEKGRPPNVEMESAVAYILPGMQWEEGWIVRPMLGWPEEGTADTN